MFLLQMGHLSIVMRFEWALVSTCLLTQICLKFERRKQGFEIFTTCFIHTGLRLMNECDFLKDHLLSYLGARFPP